MTKYLFGDLVRNCKEKVDRDNNPYEYFVAGDHMETARPKLTMRGRFSEADVGPAFIRLFKPGQVLYGSRRTYLKKVSVPAFEGVTSNVTFVLETKDETVLPQRLLPFVLLSDRFTNYSIGKSKGSTNPYVLFSDLADFEMELPEPETVAYISDIMCAAERLKENYRSLLAACDDIVKSQFVEMFGDLRVNSRNMPVKALKDIATSRLGKMLDTKHQTGKYRRPYLTNRNVQWFSFDLHEVNSMDFSPADQVEFSLFPGDLLVCEGGEVGRCAIWRGQLQNCYFQKALHRVRCGNEVIPEYLCWWFKMMADEGMLIRHANTATIAHLSGIQLKQLTVLVPPLALQREFSDFAASVDKSKFAIQKALDELNATTKKILNQELGL